MTSHNRTVKSYNMVWGEIYKKIYIMNKGILNGMLKMPTYYDTVYLWVNSVLVNLMITICLTQVLKNLPKSYGMQRYITVFTRACHWPLSWANLIQSIPPRLIFLRQILIFFPHVRVGLPSCLFPSGFPLNTYMCSSSVPRMLHAMPI